MCESIKQHNAKLSVNPLKKLSCLDCRRYFWRKLWEIPEKYHCPVIGTCLSVAELDKLTRRAKLDTRGMSDYDKHVLFVSLVEQSKDKLMRLTQKYLLQKYARYLKQAKAIKDKATLQQFWQQAYQRGEVAAGLWVISTHPQADKALLHEVYAQVHMLSHQVGAMERADIGKIHQLQQDLDSLKQQLQRSQKQHREQIEKNTTLNQALEAAELKIRVLEQSKMPTAAQLNAKPSPNLQAHNDALKVQISNLKQTLGEQENILTQEKQRNTELEQLLDPEEAFSTTACVLEQACSQTCLEGQCVLYLGGRAGLSPHLRDLVEQKGGRFLYHDGGLEGKVQRLDPLLSQADMIFCPLNCISHAACNKARHFSKKYQKNMHLLASDSVSAFDKKLQQLGSAALV